MIHRIPVTEARPAVRAGALLVCAYDDERCQQHPLEGAIPLSALEARLDALPKDQEIVFYCA